MRIVPRTIRALSALLLMLAFHSTWAQAFPEKPVRLVVGFAPGGSDVAARIVAQQLSTLWGHQVFVDNRPGAGGNLGAEYVARAAPDGYTILSLLNSYTINTSVYKGLSWNLTRDFVPIGQYGAFPLVVVVNDKLPIKSVKDLIEYARANPGKLNFASPGAGTAPHLAAELFAQRLGLSMTHVPYKGSGPTVTALLSGEVDLSFGSHSAFEGHIKSGRLRALAVTTASRYPALPDLPTLAESGVPEFDVDVWYGLAAPAKTPAAIVRKMSEDLKKVLDDPETQRKLRGVGVEPAYRDSARLDELIRKDVARWRDVSSRINLKLD